ncbi:hypothetical protein BDR04DRAFT_1155586 [Suillus decipiens]|nr:hypothetical protein BDR04DRAFT_1155586 [Suillus decipiens]
MWEAISLDPQYAMWLDSYASCTNNFILKELILILRMAELLVTHSMVCNLSLAMHHVQDTIKKAAIKLLDTKNFSDIILKLNIECKFNLPPNDLLVVSRPHTITSDEITVDPVQLHRLPVAFTPSPLLSLIFIKSLNDYEYCPLILDKVLRRVLVMSGWSPDEL